MYCEEILEVFKIDTLSKAWYVISLLFLEHKTMCAILQDTQHIETLSLMVKKSY